MASQELLDEFMPYIEFLKRTVKKVFERKLIETQVNKLRSLSEEEEKEDLETVQSRKDEELLEYILKLETKYPSYTYEKFKEGILEDLKEEEEEASDTNTVGVVQPDVVSEATGVGLPSEEDVSSCGIIGRPVKAKSTLAQGDCFYSSVYRSAGEAGLLKKIQECLGIQVDTEDNFIDDFRGIVATRIMTGDLPSEDGGDIFQVLVERVLGGLWKPVLEAYPKWFQKAFAKGLPKKERFLEKLARFAGTRMNDVSEIEVRLIEKILGECRIKINIYNHAISRGIPGELNLWNQREYHWVYFSFDVGEGYENSEEFIDLEYEECVRKCKGDKIRKETEARHYSDYKAWKKNPKSKPDFEKRKGYTYDGEVFTGGRRKRRTPRKKSMVTEKRFNLTRTKSKH